MELTTNNGVTEFLYPVQSVQTEVKMSNSISTIAMALSKVQSELTAVKKDEKGYGYNYSSLASTIEVSKPVLAKNNLAISQLVGNASNGSPSVTTILMHGGTGEYIMSTASMEKITMKGCNVAQESGATLSYLRRYALQALLNMASEDNDASSNGFVKPETTTSFSKKTEVTTPVVSVTANANTSNGSGSVVGLAQTVNKIQATVSNVEAKTTTIPQKFRRKPKTTTEETEDDI